MCVLMRFVNYTNFFSEGQLTNTSTTKETEWWSMWKQIIVSVLWRTVKEL